MEPDVKTLLREKMEQASLKELMPDFDASATWTGINNKLHYSREKRFNLLSWHSLAATMAILITLAYGAIWIVGNNKQSNLADTAYTSHRWAADMLPATNIDSSHEASQNNTTGNVKNNAVAIDQEKRTLRNEHKHPLKPAQNHNNGNHTQGPQLYNYSRNNDFVCNGTACPLEICIIQTIKCPDEAPSAIATCSTLQPDQSGALKLKSPVEKNGRCQIIINEIRIKRVSTGETIVLNSHSTPSTAQDFFDCITNNSKCNIVAGIFHSDCNNNNTDHSLKIDNNQGVLTIQ